MFLYERLSRKPLLLFKLFTAGLTVQEFDNIFQKEITKRYDKHETLRLYEEKNIEKEKQVLLEDHSNLT